MNLELDTLGNYQSEQELLSLLSERVAQLLEQEPDLLMSLLYRLDVEEQAILKAMNPGNEVPAHVGLAQLVLDRQKQRREIKKSTAVNDNDIPQGWEW
jgi:histone deacetylase complex regulatory component SIN3